MRRRKSNEQGVLFLELAIILPILAFVVFVSLDFARYLQSTNIAATISREVGNVVSRECIYSLDTLRMATCINQQHSRFAAMFSNPDLGAVEIVVSVVESNSGNFSLVFRTSGDSEFDISGGSFVEAPYDSFNQGNLPDEGFIVISEARMPFSFFFASGLNLMDAYSASII